MLHGFIHSERHLPFPNSMVRTCWGPAIRNFNFARLIQLWRQSGGTSAISDTIVSPCQLLSQRLTPHTQARENECHKSNRDRRYIIRMPRNYTRCKVAPHKRAIVAAACLEELQNLRGGKVNGGFKTTWFLDGVSEMSSTQSGMNLPMEAT